MLFSRMKATPTAQDMIKIEEAADKASKLVDELVEGYDEIATPENCKRLSNEIKEAQQASRDAEAAYHRAFRKFSRA